MNRGVDIFSLQGKCALVTGATGHLGKAMAFVLAEAGARLLINSRNEKSCASIVEELNRCGAAAEVAHFDVTSQSEIDRYFSSRGDRPLHILINNAYAGASGNISVANPEDYAASYEITVVSAHRILKAALPSLRQAVAGSEGASVINIGTMYALVSPDQRVYDGPNNVNPPFYGAAKAALLQWTRYAACEFGPEGIRVNALSPGPFPTDSVQRSDPEFIQRLSNKVPCGRMGSPDDIKGPILFLASSASSYVNGANIVVDGGWTCL